jgi:hypothetical protein
MSTRVVSVREVKPAGAEWPSFFLLTDGGSYEVSSFGVQAKEPPAGPASERLPQSLAGQRITQVRHRAPSVVVELENGTKLVFDVTYSPFTDTSWPTFDIQSKEQAHEWADEYQDMDVVKI